MEKCQTGLAINSFAFPPEKILHQRLTAFSSTEESWWILLQVWPLQFQSSESTSFRPWIIRRVTCSRKTRNFLPNPFWHVYVVILDTVCNINFLKHFYYSLLCVYLLCLLRHWHTEYFLVTLYLFFVKRNLYKWAASCILLIIYVCHICHTVKVIRMLFLHINAKYIPSSLL